MLTTVGEREETGRERERERERERGKNKTWWSGELPHLLYYCGKEARYLTIVLILSFLGNTCGNQDSSF